MDQYCKIVNRVNKLNQKYQISAEQQCMSFGMITENQNRKKTQNYALQIQIASQTA